MSLTVRPVTVEEFDTLRSNLFSPIEKEFDKIFDKFFTNPVLDGVKSNVGYPKADVLVDANNFIIRLSVPGLNVEDITIEMLPNRVIRISGEMSEEVKSGKSNKYLVHELHGEFMRYYLKELHKSKFSRDFSLPEYAKGDPIADLKNGLLTLSWRYMPVVEDKPKRIEIKT